MLLFMAPGSFTAWSLATFALELVAFTEQLVARWRGARMEPTPRRMGSKQRKRVVMAAANGKNVTGLDGAMAGRLPAIVLAACSARTSTTRPVLFATADSLLGALGGTDSEEHSPAGSRVCHSQLTAPWLPILPRSGGSLLSRRQRPADHRWASGRSRRDRCTTACTQTRDDLIGAGEGSVMRSAEWLLGGQGQQGGAATRE